MTGAEFDAFVREHQRMVRALAFSYLRDDHAADDLAQEVFLRAWKSVDGVAHPKTWLYAMTRNAAIDHLRARRRSLPIEEKVMDVPAPPPAEPDDRIAKVMRVVDGLREDYRQIILLRYVENLPYARIAEALGMTVTAVGEKLHRVRALIATEAQR